MKQGIFYNSAAAKCSVYEIGRMCYDTLKTATTYSLDYSEARVFEPKYDFAVFNHHEATCNWMTREMFSDYKGKTFCIVSQVMINTRETKDVIAKAPKFFDFYIVLDPTVQQSNNIYGFPRPILPCVSPPFPPSPPAVVIGSVGFATPGKEWHSMVQAVQDEFDTALVRFHIPAATYVGNHQECVAEIRAKCAKIIKKPGIRLEITCHAMARQEIVAWCAQNTINCFFYRREETVSCSLSASTDYALASGRPILVTNDQTFRHLLTYVKPFPTMKIKEAIASTGSIVKKIGEDWCTEHFVAKFNLLLSQAFLPKRKGVFYNSIEAKCSIYESGRMCYNALKTSQNYTLHYNESKTFNGNGYDFAIFNHHPATCNWMRPEMFRNYSGKTFCIVTEVTFHGPSPIQRSPDYYNHYIVLDPTVRETAKIHAFPRPLEEIDYSSLPNAEERGYPVIGSFGFATPGKDWHTIVEAVQAEYDTALVRFNMPFASYVPGNQERIDQAMAACKKILKKPGIKIELTHTYMTPRELIRWCARNTINCFFYHREVTTPAGLAAVTDQAVSSGRPLLVTRDQTFRHLLTYIKPFPDIGIKQAIASSHEQVRRMRQDWNPTNFAAKFERILFAPLY